MKIEIYSDGSAQTADKPGGYGWVLIVDGHYHSEGSGHLEKATNNDAELIASLKGLEAALNFIAADPSSFPQEHEVTLKSDSEIVLGWASGVYRFKQTEKMPLYNELIRLMKKTRAKTQWIKGHSGHVHQERCDELANAARLNLPTPQIKDKILTHSLIGKKKEGVSCIWYGDQLKIISLTNNIIEDYDREKHGKRGSSLEIRKEKLR
jgi:ribonuclease HI